MAAARPTTAGGVILDRLRVLLIGEQRQPQQRLVVLVETHDLLVADVEIGVEDLEAELLAEDEEGTAAPAECALDGRLPGAVAIELGDRTTLFRNVSQELVEEEVAVRLAGHGFGSWVAARAPARGEAYAIPR